MDSSEAEIRAGRESLRNLHCDPAWCTRSISGCVARSSFAELLSILRFHQGASIVVSIHRAPSEYLASNCARAHVMRFEEHFEMR